MLQAFVVTLREGLEAFLIVAISLAYLRKTGRKSLIPAVHWGILASIAVSIVAGVLLAQAANQALWEGILALVAAALVASLIVHMWRAGRHLKKNIEGRLEASSSRTGTAAFLGVFGFTLLMITREGMETALLMNALLFQVRSIDIIGGAVAGTLVAAFVAWLWTRFGHRVNLGAVLSGHGRLPAGLRRAAPHLRHPRADRGEYFPQQPALARRDRAVRPGWHLRSVPHVPPGRIAARLARRLELLRTRQQHRTAIADGVELSALSCQLQLAAKCRSYQFRAQSVSYRQKQIRISRIAES